MSTAISRNANLVWQLVCTVVLVVPGAAQTRAPASAGAASKGQVIVEKVHAPALAGNLLGDPVEQNVSIYLPPSYNSNATKRYPSLYLLHGFGGTHTSWTQGYRGAFL